MTATFYNTARLLDYGAVELKRLTGKHAVYGLVLSVGVIGAVFLAFVGIDSIFTRTVDIPKRAVIDWIYTPNPPKLQAMELNSNATSCPINTGTGTRLSTSSLDKAVPVAAPDITVPDTRFPDADVFQTPVQDPFADGGKLGGGDNTNGIFNPNGVIGKNNREGTSNLGVDDEEVWKEYPDVLPQVDMNELRRHVLYPSIAQRRNLEGKVVVSVTIDASGKVVDCSVAHSTNDIFNSAALEAVRQSQFTPAMRNRQPVQFRMMIPIEFKMK